MFCKKCGINIDRYLSDIIYECPNCHQRLDAEAVHIAKAQQDIIKYEKWANRSFVMGILSIVFSLGLGLLITGPLGIYFTRKADGVRRTVEAYLSSMELPYVEKYRVAKKKLDMGVKLSKIAVAIPVSLLAVLFLGGIFGGLVMALLNALV